MRLSELIYSIIITILAASIFIGMVYAAYQVTQYVNSMTMVL